MEFRSDMAERSRISARAPSVVGDLPRASLRSTTKLSSSPIGSDRNQ